MSKDTLKKQMIELYREGKSVDEISTLYNIPKSTFYRWLRKSRGDNPTISDEDIRLIVTKISALEEEAMTYKKVLQLIKK